MSFSNQITIKGQSMLRKIALVAGLATSLASSGVVRATVTPLSGGDSGEGYAPLPTTVYAYNVSTAASPSSYTVQNVNFVGTNSFSPPSVTFTGFSTFVTTPTSFTVSTTNDSNIAAILFDGGNQQYFGFSASATVTLSGLSPLQTYQVDILSDPFTTRLETFSFSGDAATTAIPLVDSFSASAGTGYDVRQTLAPSGSGNIVVTVSGGANPFLNGFSVTAPLPEPASLGLLSVGGLLLMRRRAAR